MAQASRATHNGSGRDGTVPLDIIVEVRQLKRASPREPLTAEMANTLGQGLLTRIWRADDKVLKRKLLALFNSASKCGNRYMFDTAMNFIKAILDARDRKPLMKDLATITAQLEHWQEVEAD